MTTNRPTRRRASMIMKDVENDILTIEQAIAEQEQVEEQEEQETSDS